MNIENVKMLVQAKEKIVSSDEEKNKLQVIKSFLEVPNCFLNVPLETAVGMLDFLGVPESQIKEAYFDLISFDNYQMTDGVRFTISNDK